MRTKVRKVENTKVKKVVFDKVQVRNEKSCYSSGTIINDVVVVVLVVVWLSVWGWGYHLCENMKQWIS